MISNAVLHSCADCPRRQQYYPVGSCPECGAPGLMMNTKTHVAICKHCSADLAIPLLVPMNCASYVQQTRFEVQFRGVTKPAQIVAVAITLGLNGADLYRAMKEGWAEISNLSLQDVYRLKRVVEGTSIEMKVLPELIEYEDFERCWNVY